MFTFTDKNFQVYHWQNKQTFTYPDTPYHKDIQMVNSYDSEESLESTAGTPFANIWSEGASYMRWKITEIVS
jgi:hypothetical protein